jgi:hypothetical protein
MVTAEIMLRVRRVAGRRSTGVWPFGAKLRPWTAWFEIPVSSPQWICAPSTLARAAILGSCSAS